MTSIIFLIEKPTIIKMPMRNLTAHLSKYNGDTEKFWVSSIKRDHFVLSKETQKTIDDV